MLSEGVRCCSPSSCSRTLQRERGGRYRLLERELNETMRCCERLQEREAACEMQVIGVAEWHLQGE